MAAGRCQSRRPEPSPGKRSRAPVLRLTPRLLGLVQLGELARAPPPPLTAPRALPVSRGGAAERTEPWEAEAAK